MSAGPRMTCTEAAPRRSNRCNLPARACRVGLAIPGPIEGVHRAGPGRAGPGRLLDSLRVAARLGRRARLEAVRAADSRTGRRSAGLSSGKSPGSRRTGPVGPPTRGAGRIMLLQAAPSSRKHQLQAPALRKTERGMHAARPQARQDIALLVHE